MTEAAETPVDVRYEETDNGYYFKIFADGSYDQSVYVKAEDGSYSAYEE